MTLFIGDHRGLRYVSSLPAGPVDGQECILRVPWAAPAGASNQSQETVYWRLRYNLNIGDNYKWEFLGGAPMQAQNFGQNGNVTVAINVWDDSSIIVGLTLPLLGYYDIEFGAHQMSAGGGGLSQINVGPGAGNTNYGEVQAVNNMGTTPMGGHSRARLLVTSTDLRMKHQTAVLNGAFRGRYLRATPVRIG